MRRFVIRFIASFGLIFFFTLAYFIIPQGRTVAYAGDIDSTAPTTAVTSSAVTESESASATATEEPVVEEVKNDIKLNVKTKSLVKEKSYALKVYNLTENQKVYFKSNDASIASVDDEGVVTANAIGTTSIIVTIKDGSKTAATLQCDIIVGPPAVSVKLIRSEITLSVGKKTTLKTILQPNNTVEEVKFCSYDSAIATVSAGGRVVAKEAGVTYIYAGIDNGKYDLCKVVVLSEEVPEDTSGAEASSEPTEVSSESTEAVTQTETDEITIGYSRRTR